MVGLLIIIGIYIIAGIPIIKARLHINNSCVTYKQLSQVIVRLRMVIVGLPIF